MRLSDKKWLTWLMLFIAPPYGIYLLFRNRKEYPPAIPYIIGGLFSLPVIGMLFVEDGISVILVLLATMMIVASIVGLIKGNVTSLAIPSRKVAGLTLVLAFIAFFAFASGLPEAEQTSSTVSVPETTEVKADSEKANVEEETKNNEPEEESQQKDTNKEESEAETKDSTENKKKEVNEEKDEEDTQNDSAAPEPQGDMSVHFVDIGQGNAHVIVTPSGKVMVVDAGNNDDEDDMVAYLSQLGVKKVDYLIGSHPDADHIGGMDAVIDSFDIGTIYMPKIQANTQTFESVLLSIQNKGLSVKSGTEGINFDMGDGVKVEFLAPIGTSSDRNEMSIVVKISYGERSFLLAGDAEERSESEMLANAPGKLNADVLSVGHHGSNSSSSKAFLNAVTPIYSVIQVGKNSYGHPTPEVLQRLNDVGSEIYRNDQQGTIIITTNGKEIKVNTNAWVYKAPDKPKKEKPSTPPATPVTPPAEKPKEPVEPPKETDSISASATISNGAPTQNSNLTVSVSVVDGQGAPVSGAEVTLTLHYKSTETVYSGTTGANGVADINFRIGRAAKGFTVDGNIVVNANGLSTTTTTAFTPQ